MARHRGTPAPAPPARAAAPRRGRQLALSLRTHGGAREGAGRRPKGARAGVSHHGREPLTGREPLHVTLRAAGHVWNLRSRRCFTAFAAAVAAVARRAGEFRVVHYSVQGNHVHLIVEASSPAALSNGMNALTARFARGLNQLMGTRGKVFPDRYHAHALRTPREVRNAVAYSLANFASHARRRGDDVMAGADRFTSAGAARLSARLRPSSQAWPAAATSPARTWLLRGIGPP